jgi:hypothetical protein
MLKLDMDLKDILSYRDILKERIEEARLSGKQRALNSLLNLKDTVDMVLDTAYFATLTGVAPEIAALTGADFSSEILRLAMPNKDLRELDAHTQIEIKFDDAEVVVEEQANPSPEDPEYIKTIKRLLSHSFTKNLHEAVALYIEGTGKDLLPADALTEIKDMLGYPRPFQTWDKHLAVQYRLVSPISAFGAVKKHVPTWSDTEISRICEDAIKRVIVSQETPFTEAKQLEDLISSGINKKQIQLWKQKPESLSVYETYFGKQKDDSVMDKELGRIVAVMTPSVRVHMEKKSGRKPYVEKGY